MAITNIYKGALERSDIDKIYKGTTLLYEKVLPPQGEKWLINETPTNISVWTRFNISFLSNNKNYDRILFDQNSNSKNEIAYGGPNEIVYYDSTGGWVNQAYRTVTFETAPTGNLLTWLQANAVKQ